MALSREAPFQYQPPPVTRGETIPRAAGFRLLVDERPRADHVHTKGIQDVPARIAGKLAEDFEQSRVFQKVHYPAMEKDDFVITGTIRRFGWKLYETPLVYIPLVNLVTLTGFPLSAACGVADIQLELRDGHTGELLGTFSASSKIVVPANYYDRDPKWAGMELSESFRNVAAKLKNEILAKLQ